VVAIYRLLERERYEQSVANVMIAAYECACRELKLAGSLTDQLTEIVAKKIVEIAREGETDPDAICNRSLQELGVLRHRSA
jgi:hypothetical protein